MPRTPASELAPAVAALLPSMSSRMRAWTLAHPARANELAQRAALADNPGDRFPRATRIQSLLFDLAHFDRDGAREWAIVHGFRAPRIEPGATVLRIRQESPRRFDAATFRTITLRPGVQAVIAMPLA